MKKILLGLAFVASSMFAHTAIMSCFDNGDGNNYLRRWFFRW